nr:MAG TPA: hypothetical protein [Caudoviricetes sp.]
MCTQVINCQRICFDAFTKFFHLCFVSIFFFHHIPEKSNTTRDWKTERSDKLCDGCYVHFSSPLFRVFIITLRLDFVNLLCYNIFRNKNS